MAAIIRICDLGLCVVCRRRGACRCSDGRGILHAAAFGRVQTKRRIRDGEQKSHEFTSSASSLCMKHTKLCKLIHALMRVVLTFPTYIYTYRVSITHTYIYTYIYIYVHVHVHVHVHVYVYVYVYVFQYVYR